MRGLWLWGYGCHLSVINPRRACAARVTVLGLCFHVSVCLREIWHYRDQAGIWVIRRASVRQAHENICVAFAKSIAFNLEMPPGSKDRFVTQPTNYHGPSMHIIRTRVLYIVGKRQRPHNRLMQDMQLSMRRGFALQCFSLLLL